MNHISLDHLAYADTHSIKMLYLVNNLLRVNALKCGITSVCTLKGSHHEKLDEAELEEITATPDTRVCSPYLDRSVCCN